VTGFLRLDVGSCFRRRTLDPHANLHALRRLPPRGTTPARPGDCTFSRATPSFRYNREKRSLLAVQILGNREEEAQIITMLTKSAA
jgi:hypothetical protein